VWEVCVINAATTAKGHIHMAAVTATILLGGSHPNDTSVDPYYLMKLWEGDRELIDNLHRVRTGKSVTAIHLEKLTQSCE
jgi:hypothetical protein